MMEETELDQKEYCALKENCFESQLHNWNPVRAWFHKSRNNIVINCIKKYYKKGDKIVDLGCGNCLWNTEGIPVIGIDLNKKMMEYAKKRGRLTSYYICDI